MFYLKMIQEQKRYHGNQLFMQLEDRVVDILIGDELTKTDRRLFWYLFKLEQWGDRFIDLPSESEIASALGVSRQSINQSQAKLQKLELWDFKTTGWKARNLVGPKSYTISEKTDADSEKNATNIHEECAPAFQTNKDSLRTEVEATTAAETLLIEVEVLAEEVGLTPPASLFSTADPQILKEIERIVYDWRLRPWMESPNTFKPEIVQAVWQCNTQWYSLEDSKTPNLKKIGDRLRKLDGQLKKLDSGAIQAHSELQNYWTTAQAITNPEIEQAFHQAAIQRHQQQTRFSIEQALDGPEGGTF